MTALDTCPVPPTDLGSRNLQIRELDVAVTPLVRIHNAAFGPIYYRRKAVGLEQFRFDAPNGEFGVLYAALSLEAAFIETVVRGRFIGKSLPLMIEEAKLKELAVSHLIPATGRILRLADFTRPLVSLGGNGQVLTSPNYDVTNQWSLAVHQHKTCVDGILFQSRYSNSECVAIYDRAILAAASSPRLLSDSPDVPGILDKLEIGLI